MADNPQEAPKKYLFRVFSDEQGDVFLLIDGSERSVKIQEPVSDETIKNAQEVLLLEGNNEAQRRISAPRANANHKIEAALFPFRKGNLLGRVEFVQRELLFVFITLVIAVLPYKGIQYSSQHFPRPVHFLILVVCLAGLVFCIGSIATEDNRWKARDQINVLLGPRGFLILPVVILLTAGAVIASVTFALHTNGLVILEPCRGRPVSEASLLDFYMWHFLKLVPLLKPNEVLKWNDEPLCYSQSRVGFLILVFQGFVVIPSIKTITFYWKNRRTLATRFGECVFDPAWQPKPSPDTTTGINKESAATHPVVNDSDPRVP